MDFEAIFYVVFFTLVMPMGWMFGATYFKHWRRRHEAEPRLGDEVQEELEQLRTRVVELEERVDFTERMLAARKDAVGLPGGKG